jgi:hypothetical protein
MGSSSNMMKGSATPGFCGTDGQFEGGLAIEGGSLLGGRVLW